MIRRQMNGLMNRLSDASKDSVVRSVKAIFDANSLSVVCNLPRFLSSLCIYVILQFSFDDEGADIHQLFFSMYLIVCITLFRNWSKFLLIDDSFSLLHPIIILSILSLIKFFLSL